MGNIKREKKRKKSYLWIGIAAAIVLLMIGSKTCNKDKGVIEIEVSKPVRKTISETIPANGKIQPVTEVKISPDVSGEIVELNVKEGDRVKKGDLIIKIKQDIYLSAVEQALASLNSTRAAYMQQQAHTLRIKQTYERNKQLYELKTISKAEYEAACADWDVAQQQLSGAKYNISSAEARLKEARENLQKTTIYSPMDGIVSKLSVELGERVVGTSQMAGTEMLRVANFHQMEVLVDVNENDIIRLNIGDSAKISVDAYLDRKFSGVVTEVANSSKGSTTSLDQATTFEVKVRINPESYQDLVSENSNPFRPGMSASVQIKTSVAENVLSLPISAITTRSDLQSKEGDGSVKQFVFIYDTESKNVTPVEVKTGLQDISDIEIKEGVTENSNVVIGPFTAISKSLKKEGSKVKLKKELESKEGKDNKKEENK
ncbi:MAG: efflux RND transporter periplasmic adaptor subunit [Bacteroidales bacterium]|nr:efflux RND transporter periplasmic adaptor subunit [Bacteroidales bacterium]